ncbi:glutathione S-transferase family protein [Marinobacter fonticola]|uniref:glutathione S-transferase family protein n=1 Tax=Marinobacter fonticola TaxID=2603215 RepID=UPI0011E66C0B|nr:glutathione S-transferase family protein [Marinobacter fonticola]
MLLYGVPLSPFVRKTLFMIYEMELKIDRELVVPGSDLAAFRRASPLGRIPALVDGSLYLWDSSAICHYLARRYESELIPYKDPQQFARIITQDKYADEDLSAAVFEPLLERVIKPVRFGKASDETVVQASINQKMPPVFDYLESQLEESGEQWFAGTDFTFADITLGGHMSNLFLAGIDIESTRWPALSAWFNRLSKRPAFKQLCEEARSFRP